jgi:hypothetical protein
MLKMSERQINLRGHDLVLSVDELWWRCFALGTMNTALELEAFLRGTAWPTRHEYNVIAVARVSGRNRADAVHPVHRGRRVGCRVAPQVGGDSCAKSVVPPPKGYRCLTPTRVPSAATKRPSGPRQSR